MPKNATEVTTLWMRVKTTSPATGATLESSRRLCQIAQSDSHDVLKALMPELPLYKAHGTEVEFFCKS